MVKPWTVPVVALVLVVMSAPARATCDVTGVDAASIAAGRDAIDAGCPCAAAANRGDYRRCATDIVKARVTAALLARGCRRETLKHAKLSICGRPGAVVCCRVRPDGHARHRVFSEAAKCVNSHALVACVSSWQSVPTGCDKTGCISTSTTSSTSTSTSTSSSTSMPPPSCGNGIVEAGEGCDPPDAVYCDQSCQSRICASPATTCGNGTVDAGEACEPPGVGACAPDCQAASCGVPAAGEIGIACDVPSSDLSAAATASTYLVGWSELGDSRVLPFLVPALAINAVVRRFDVNGAPLDSGRTVLSTDAPCAHHQPSALASDGQDFYAVWRSIGPTEGDTYSYIEVLGRRVGGGSGIGPLDHLALQIPVGTCRVVYGGPTMAAGVSPARFAVGWQEYGSCFGSPVFQDPLARVVDFNAVPVPQSFDIGLTPFGPPTGAASQSAASVAQLGADTVWVWHALFGSGPQPPFEHFVTAVFTDLDGADPHVVLSHRNERIGGRPGVAAGASSFLVAWGQGASAVATTVTEIRAVRATRADGRLDPDGGLLLATSSTVITGGPVVAFDGTRWLVVWAEESGSTHDLRAVAVESDGTVVDASPRLVASDVVAGEPAVASTGDGRVLVVYARPHDATRDVVATLVTP